MLDQLFGFIGNPIFLMLIGFPILLLVGIYVGAWLTHPRKNRVLQIDPESGRGIDFEVDREDTINAYCKPVGDIPPQRFLKLHTPYNIVRKGLFKLQTYALYIGRKGTAYTQKMNPSNVKVPFRDLVENVFGKDLYARIPNDAPERVKDKVEQSEVAVTVQLSKDDPLTPTGTDGNPLPSISSDDFQSNRMQAFLNLYSRGVSRMTKALASADALKIIFIFGAGIGAGVILSLIFKWGAPTYIEPAKAILSCLVGWRG